MKSASFRYSGDPVLDAIADELISVERRIRSVSGEIRRRLEHGLGLRDKEQRRRLEVYGRALLERGRLRALQREHLEQLADDEERRA